MSPKWLGSLVRARQMQEDAAQQRLAVAERGARAARLAERREAQRLDGLDAPDDASDGAAFVAAAVALQAAAATHAAAQFAAAQADEATGVRRTELRTAAIAANSVEELQNRMVRVETERAARVAQRDEDEIAAGIHRRRSEAES
jgi:hypothetical protein